MSGPQQHGTTLEVVPGVVARSPGPVEPRVSICPHGPALVRGAVEVVHDGASHAADHPVVAVCRCEKSSSLPWCDSTHRSIPGY